MVGTSAELQKMILAMVCCSTVSKVSHGTCQPGVERDIVNRVQLDVRAAVPEAQAPTDDNRGAVAKTSLHQAIHGIGEVRVHGPDVSGASMRELGLKPADHN